MSVVSSSPEANATETSFGLRRILCAELETTWQELAEIRPEGDFLQLPPSTQILLPDVHEIYLRKSLLYLLDKATYAGEGTSATISPSGFTLQRLNRPANHEWGLPQLYNSEDHQHELIVNFSYTGNRVMIVGDPGLGMSVWLLLLLHSLGRRGQIVVLERPGNAILFSR